MAGGQSIQKAASMTFVVHDIGGGQREAGIVIVHHCPCTVYLMSQHMTRSPWPNICSISS